MNNTENNQHIDPKTKLPYQIHCINHLLLADLIHQTPLSTIESTETTETTINTAPPTLYPKEIASTQHQHTIITPHPTASTITFRHNTIANGSALILLNRPYKQTELYQLWTSTVIRVIVDGAINRLFKICRNNIEISHSQLPEIDLSTLPSQPFIEIMKSNIGPDGLPHDGQGNSLCHSGNSKDINPETTITHLHPTSRNPSTAPTLLSLLAQYDITITPLFPINIPPDIIIGDLDSAHPVLLRFAQDLFGTQIIKSFCQDTTDFQKALIFLSQYKGDAREVIHHNNIESMDRMHEEGPCGKTSTNPSPRTIGPENTDPPNPSHLDTITHQRAHQCPPIQIFSCLCYNSFGGRFDQYMANVHTLYSFADYFTQILLLGDGNIVQLLKPMTLVNLDAFIRHELYIKVRDSVNGTDTKINDSSDVFLPHPSTSTHSSLINSQRTLASTTRALLTAHKKKVYAGVVPQLGTTRCSWVGMEWDLGDESHNIGILKQLLELTSGIKESIDEKKDVETGERKIQNRNENQDALDTDQNNTDHRYLTLNSSSPSHYTLDISVDRHMRLYDSITSSLETGVDCGFDGLVSNNNWLRPVVLTTTTSNHYQNPHSIQDLNALENLKQEAISAESDSKQSYVALFLCDKRMILSLSYAEE